MSLSDPRSRVFVALDLDGLAQAERLIAQLGEAASCYKIGYQLGYQGGLGLAKELIQHGKTVFIDFKLHDIDNTVRHGVEAIAKLGAHYLTVHAYPQTMRAADAGRHGSDLKILPVTILTSWDAVDCAEAGYAGSIETLVTSKAKQAVALGMDGIVCSAREAKMLRQAGIPERIELVTPGIRPLGSASGDQVRIVTPAAAIADGATRLVVGRPITQSPDPKVAAEAIVAEVAAALAS